MSAIKDLVDLVTQLNKSVTDRRIREAFLPVREKVIEVQHELLELEKAQFESERKHHAEVAELKTLHTNEVAELKRQHETAMRQHETAMAELGIPIPLGTED